MMAAPDAPHPDRVSWLDHPLVAAHYRERGLIDGLCWESWVAAQTGGAVDRSLQLWAGNGSRSFLLFERGWARAIDGIDASDAQAELAEAGREACRAPGNFRVADLNSFRLPARTYDLVFACHSLHQAVALEHVLDQVVSALVPGGLFVMEGYAGPSRFQWSDEQMALVKMLTGWLPDRLRRLPWGAVKPYEGRPERVAVATASLFDAVRSAEIPAAVRARFDVVVTRTLGGTLQHLLYNGIVQNFADADEAATQFVTRLIALEDTLIDAGMLPSDFNLLIGRKR